MYPTLTHRLLSLHLLYLSSHITRQLSFDYMHQHMAMTVVADTATTFAALVDWRRAGTAARHAVRWLTGAEGGDEDEAGGGKFGGSRRVRGVGVRCVSGVCV